MAGRKESMRVQVWKNKKVIGDVSIQYKWEKNFWPDALMRIRAAAKAYEESNQRLDIKACFNIFKQFQARLKLIGKNHSKLIGNSKKIV